MPNVWTHILFGEKTLERIQYRLPSDDVLPFFRLGCQGPDLFFYHNFWPWAKDLGVSAIGENIHRNHCGPFLIDMIRGGFRNANDFYVQAYILGFLTHHLLDRNTHPYIIYRSGMDDHKHEKLEIIIDTLLMDETYGIKTWHIPVYQKINIGKSLYGPIEQLLKSLIRRYFPDDAAKLPETFAAESYRNMIQALKVLHDPIGWKNKWLKKFVHPYSYRPITEQKDYLNRKRRIWYHPADPNEKHSESFDDMLDHAYAEAERILEAVLDYWKNGLDEASEGLSNELGNYAYDTGKDCRDTVTCKYFDPMI
ncbi:MAG TPA: zinc dependent phospholipase C family protein [Bacillales bacterium]|nr:zinc dependent phospholipase C family protein [Bacillales bacterium]